MLLLYPWTPTSLEPEHGKAESWQLFLVRLELSIEIRVLLNRSFEGHILRQRVNFVGIMVDFGDCAKVRLSEGY